mmetsp:Transcript_21273/g.52980  ORF Transcript_21273/g.52980 Transcript_21273/m.52980 type:complete len:85 (+) Transcript_21273:324-578(+)
MPAVLNRSHINIARRLSYQQGFRNSVISSGAHFSARSLDKDPYSNQDLVSALLLQAGIHRIFGFVEIARYVPSLNRIEPLCKIW